MQASRLPLLLLIAAASPQAFKVEKKSSLYSYSYDWPAEAVAIPALNQKLAARMKKDREDLVEMAMSAKKEGGWFPPDGYESNMGWELAGQSTRLLSLSGSHWEYTGGAHGNGGTSALLWDRKLNREIAIQNLLSTGTSWNGAIRQPFCVLLDRERSERREEPVKKDDVFGDCPSLSSVSVLLEDSDKNRRFDHILVTADPYVAGPYVEGAYEISLPITAAMIDRLKPEYRSSFEPRPPVK
jgi:Deacetylase PdaC